MLICLEDSFEESHDADPTVVERSNISLSDGVNLGCELPRNQVKESVEAEVKFSGRVAVLFANEDLGPILELHIGCLARENEGLDTEQLVL